MKIEARQRVEIEVTAIRIEVAVKYDAEDIPYNFPLRKGNMWEATVDIDTGKIRDWPVGQTGDMYMKVCDNGTYALLGPDGKEIAKREGEYVPNDVVPGEWGDYIDLHIDANGVITNWPKNPDVGVFFDDND